MLKDSFKLSLKIAAVIITYYILDYFFERTLMIIILVGVAILFVLFNSIFKYNLDYNLELMVDADAYLNKINKKLSNKEDYIYNTYKAYAYVHQGEYDKAAEALSSVTLEDVSVKNDLLVKYYNSRLKLAFNNEDLELYTRLLNDLGETKFPKKIIIDLRVYEVPKLILEKNYVEVVEMLMEMIPRQPSRVVVIELEYYLAKAYVELNNVDNARAVLDFVTSRQFKVIYIKKCKELLDELPQLEVEETNTED